MSALAHGGCYLWVALQACNVRDNSGPLAADGTGHDYKIDAFLAQAQKAQVLFHNQPPPPKSLVNLFLGPSKPTCAVANLYDLAENHPATRHRLEIFFDSGSLRLGCSPTQPPILLQSITTSRPQTSTKWRFFGATRRRKITFYTFGSATMA